MRVITLTPSATELVCAIGGQSLLVGRSHDSNAPGGIENVPAVTTSTIPSGSPAEIDAAVHTAIGNSGTLHLLNRQMIDELAPDVIITQQTCNVCAVDAAAVDEAIAQLDKQPEILSLDPHSIEDVLEDVIRVGEAIDRQTSAQECMVNLRARFCDARDRVNPYVDGPRVAVIEWAEPIYLAGHWTPGLLAAAGGQPVGPPEGMPSITVTEAELADLSPERLVIAPCGVHENEMAPHLKTLRDLAIWPELVTENEANVLVLDGTWSFSRPGPRLIDTFEILVDWLHAADG